MNILRLFGCCSSTPQLPPEPYDVKTGKGLTGKPETADDGTVKGPRIIKVDKEEPPDADLLLAILRASKNTSLTDDEVKALLIRVSEKKQRL